MKKFIAILALCTISFAGTLSEVLERNELRVGVYRDNPPFSIMDGNEFIGFDIDFMKVLGQMFFGESNGQVRFIPISRQNISQSLERNSVDVVLPGFIGEIEVKKAIDSSYPYFAVDISALTRKADKITDLSQLEGKAVLAKQGSLKEYHLRNSGVFSSVIGCNEPNDCVKALLAGQAEAYIDNNLVVAALPQMDSSLEVGIKNLIGEPILFTIAVQKGNKSLLNKIDESLAQLHSNGYFKQIYHDYFEFFYKGALTEDEFVLDKYYNPSKDEKSE